MPSDNVTDHLPSQLDVFIVNQSLLEVGSRSESNAHGSCSPERVGSEAKHLSKTDHVSINSLSAEDI